MFGLRSEKFRAVTLTHSTMFLFLFFSQLKHKTELTDIRGIRDNILKSKKVTYLYNAVEHTPSTEVWVRLGSYLLKWGNTGQITLSQINFDFESPTQFFWPGKEPRLSELGAVLTQLWEVLWGSQRRTFGGRGARGFQSLPSYSAQTRAVSQMQWFCSFLKLWYLSIWVQVQGLG